jgi:GTP cyclohydrolase I
MLDDFLLGLSRIILYCLTIILTVMTVYAFVKFCVTDKEIKVSNHHVNTLMMDGNFKFNEK